MMQNKSFSKVKCLSNFFIATLTTVGYGDVYPITPLGQFLGGIIAIIGIGLFTLPTGILASGFSDEYWEEFLKDVRKNNAEPKLG